MPDFKFLSQYEVKVNIFLPADHAGDLNTTLVLLTAIGVTIKKYQKTIDQLTALGYTIIAADYPCCGENRPHIDRTVNYNYSDLVDQFIPELLHYAQTDRVILFGHSLGAHLASLYATEHHTPVIGVATGNIHYKNWSGLGKLKILQAVAAFKLLTQIYGYFPGYKIGFGNKEAKGVINDWIHTALTGNYHFYKNPLTISQSKALFINMIADDFAPLKSTQGLAKLFHAADIKTLKLDSTLKGNPHSIWLKQPSQVTQLIDQTVKTL